MARPPGFSQGATADDSQRVAVVIVAAGGSRRMAGVDKIFAPLQGAPLISHTIDAFERCSQVGLITLVLSEDNVERGRKLTLKHLWSKLTPELVCSGGLRRQDSVRLGLDMVDGARYPWIAVHDGARPCVEPQLLERGLEAARETGAAVAAVPAKDTVKVVALDGMVESTPARESLWMVQTPQIFSYELILEAHSACPPDEVFTDDAALVERLGRSVKVFMGSYSNLKVTTPEDMDVARMYLKSQIASGNQISVQGT